MSGWLCRWFVIGTWGRCLLCGVWFCYPIVSVGISSAFVWGFATWGCYFWLALGVVWGFATWGCCFWFAFGGGACVVVSRTGIQSCGSCSVLIGTCDVCMAISPFFMVPRRFLFFDNGEVTASLRYAFHTKNTLFSKKCHVAVSGSKVTNDPSKCLQERGLLPYYHNLFVMFVIFGKKWRVVFRSVIQSCRLAYLVAFVWGFATWGCYFWLARGGGACVVVSRTGIQSCWSCSVLIGTCGVCMAISPFFMVPRRFLSVLSSYRPPIQIWVPTWIDEILIYLIQSFFNSNFRLEAKK